MLRTRVLQARPLQLLNCTMWHVVYTRTHTHIYRHAFGELTPSSSCGVGECVWYEIGGMGAGGLGQQRVDVERGLGRRGQDAGGREARHVGGAVPRRPCRWCRGTKLITSLLLTIGRLKTPDHSKTKKGNRDWYWPRRGDEEDGGVMKR